MKVKIPLESSKDTKDYRENVCDEGNPTNGIGNTNFGFKAKDQDEEKKGKNERI